MIFFLSDIDQISCHSIRNFITFSWHLYWVFVWHPLFYCDLQIFFFFNNFISIAYLTFSSLSDYFSFSLAFITVLLNLLIHSRTHLEHLDNSSFALASLTFFNIFPSFSFTLFTTSSSFVLYFYCFSIVNILKANLKRFLCRLYFCRTSTLLSSSSTSKEHVEEVISASLWSFGSEFIINFSFLSILQCFVCFTNLLELNKRKNTFSAFPPFLSG